MTATAVIGTELPEPTLERWQPLRAGLVDLFYYDAEEFWFRDGRLLLRGNNGTGKSKVLALMLPFLLDGELGPHRVEPDADPRKRMEWNLLLGGAHPYPERLGYTWLEFGRVDEHGVPRFRTLGCGLKAVAGKGIARHWFFVTEHRVGAGLALIDATGTALTRDRLIDALGEGGSAYDRARDYRRAVDEQLFGLGEQRYGALVDLLIQLRQPQLSKRPSEEKLSEALTEALPPLDQAVIADVAEAFRGLEDDRDALAAMIEARDAAASFLGQYRRYARIAARRRAALPRRAQSEYERVRTAHAEAEAALARAVGDIEAARARTAELADERNRLTARDGALRASPEMRSAERLDTAAAQARRLADERDRAGGERDGAGAEVARRRARHSDAGERLAAATATVRAGRRTSTEAAQAAMITAEHAELVDSLISAPVPDTAALLTAAPDADVPDAAGPAAEPEQAATSRSSTARRAAERLADRQQRAIGHVTGLIDAAEAARRALADARAALAELDAEADDLAARRANADERVRDAGTALVAAVRAHLERAEELRLPDLAATSAALELWVETLSGPNPATAAARTAGQDAATTLARADAELAGAERAATERRDELADEIARLERGEDTAPPVPHTRDAARRADRAGAPLWQLIDFAEDVPEDDRAGLEAALEAAGILDAWMTPAGELLGTEHDDVLLHAGAATEANLTAVLRPAVDRDDPRAATVADETITALLTGIGLGEREQGPTWVGTDGRFRIGVLDGHWHKPAAMYIGRGARESARRARLATLRDDHARAQDELARLAADRRRISERTRTLAAELDALPGDAALRQAHAQVATLVEEATRLAARHERAATAVTTATAEQEATATALADGARDAGLPTDRAALAEVTNALADYRVALAGLWPALDAHRDAARHERTTRDDLERAETTLAERRERAADLEREAAAADEHYRTLHDTVGAAVKELEAQLAEVAARLGKNEEERADAAKETERAINASGKAEGLRDELGRQLETTTATRAEAAESFRRFAGTGLLAVALPALDTPDPATPWAPDPTVRLARRVNDELADAPDDDGAWDRAQQRVNNELKTLHDVLSRRGNKAEADLREDGVVVEIEFAGRRTSVPELADALATEVADRERLLSEREREILENHLVNEVASTLQELLFAAEAQVAAMNAELASRPTSTGMRLRLLWRPRENGPAGLEAARERLLRQTADAWSEEDRSAVGEFLQGRIEAERAADTTGTWQEHLTRALDYRRWNRFVIQRHQSGQWRSATGPASGGERVLAASVPLFAAASAHYASAGNPHAPRLVTLDEAFAGVDDNARAKYLGLLAAFELDVVMTSEREWGCYPEVPGLAISQLSRTDEVAAVLVTNWEWDGANRARAHRPVRPIRPLGGDGARAENTENAEIAEDTENSAASQGGLWG